MSHKKKVRSINHTRQFIRLGLAAAITVASAASYAGEPIFFNNGKLEWSITTSYGIGMRMEDQDKALIAGANADDGDRNFNKHSLVTNGVNALGELIYTNDNGWGAVLRGSTFYDNVYHRHNDNDSMTVNKFGRADEFGSGAEHYSGGRSRLLDAYVFANFDLPDNEYMTVKAGRQVVSWGEGLFYPGVNGAQGPVDVVKSNTPGTETKDILLPTGQLSVNWSINQSFGLSAYYQYEWKGNELSPTGSYFSTSDVTGPRPEFLRLGHGLIARYAGKDKPSNQGQYGIRVTYRPNYNWGLSFFHINYHDKNPAGITLGNIRHGVPTSYTVDYFDNIKLTGASLSTRVGDVALSGEVSHRDGAPINVMTSQGPKATRGKGYQAQVSAIYTMGKRFWARGTTLTGEVVRVWATDVDGYKDPVSGKMDDDYTYDNAQGYQTKSSTAYTLQVSLDYPGVFPGWDLTVPINWSQVVDGNTPLKGTISGGQGDRRLSVGYKFKYLGNFQISATYTDYMGHANPREGLTLTDRDLLTMAVQYSF